jgi:hypothetical protein
LANKFVLYSNVVPPSPPPPREWIGPGETENCRCVEMSSSTSSHNDVKSRDFDLGLSASTARQIGFRGLLL